MTDREAPAEASSGTELGEKSPRGDTLYTIGQLVRLLRDEFPDLSISKVRYLEERDLIRPTRTAGGYRKYSSADLRRLRTVLTLQRDEFLPLEVIRDRLERGTASTTGRALSSGSPFDAAQALRREEGSVPWPEALEAAGVSESFLRQLVDFRLVEASPASLDARVTETDIEVARICDLLGHVGVEPRNLRLLRSSAEREVALIGQAVAPLLRSAHPERRAEGERSLHDLGLLLSRLLDLLLYKELRRLLE
jgi:DNA-binding transcriptional MerR regulator